MMHPLKDLLSPEIRWKFFCFLILEVILVSLCLWQFQRLAWKEDLLEKMARGQNVSKHTSVDNLENLADRDAHYRILNVDGEFLTKTPLKLIPRTHILHKGTKTERSALGYHLLLPMQLGRNEVLVEVGWVEHDMPLKEVIQSLQKSLRFSGIIIPPHKMGIFTPEHNLNKGEVFVIDQELLKKAGVKEKYYIRALGFENELIKPLGAPDLPANRHLSYALTWAALALLLAICFFGYFYSDNLSAND